MSDPVDLYLTGEPAMLAPFLASLGVPGYAAEGTALDARIAGVAPPRLETVAGRAVLFALVRLADGVANLGALPAGVYTEATSAAVGAAGVIMPGVPSSCTNAQMRAVLLATPAPSGGTLYDLVDQWTQAEGGQVRQAWEYANDFTRTGATVQAAQQHLGLSNAQLDDLFRAAAGLTF